MAHQGHGNMPPAGNYIPPQQQQYSAPPPGSVPPQGFGAPAPVQQGQYPQQQYYAQPSADQQHQQPSGQFPPQGQPQNQQPYQQPYQQQPPGQTPQGQPQYQQPYQQQPPGQIPQGQPQYQQPYQQPYQQQPPGQIPQGQPQYQQPYQQQPPGQIPPQGQHQWTPQQPGNGFQPQQQQPGYQQQAPGAPAAGMYNQGMPPQQGQLQQGYVAPMAPGTPAPGPKQPSPGYIPGQMSNLDATKDADALRGAMRGFGTDEKTLIMILAKADPLYMAKLVRTFKTHVGRELLKDVKSETSDKLEDALVACIRGPLMQDVYAVNKAVDRIGTDEDILTDVLVGRSNADLDAIKRAYEETYKKTTLEKDVLGDLSGDTKKLFTMILANARQEDNHYIDQQAVTNDVKELYDALVGKSTSDILAVCRVVTSRSDSHLRAVISAYDSENRIKLFKRIETSASGHLEDTILAILRGAVDPHERDATLIEKALFPLKESLLTERIIRLHWDANRKRQVMAAYQAKYKKSLVATVKMCDLKKDHKNALVTALE